MTTLIIGTGMFILGCIFIGRGWWLLCNCTGFWPDDRRNIVHGLPIFIAGAILNMWGVAYILQYFIPLHSPPFFLVSQLSVFLR